ncbi:hypothetical protein EYF80_020292 [Liparis tanakae]|uniref:Uncharacterized protein n=1 Tax=Liparis tanakae TaxID=230148 RepID=A0A4Z2HUW5_9TELE|nr:hypothetical protein EYF80_020292 [Liparis tanakae]
MDTKYNSGRCRRRQRVGLRARSLLALSAVYLENYKDSQYATDQPGEQTTGVLHLRDHGVPAHHHLPLLVSIWDNDGDDGYKAGGGGGQGSEVNTVVAATEATGGGAGPMEGVEGGWRGGVERCRSAAVWEIGKSGG